MEEPLFLRVKDVEKLHAMSLQRFGGSEGLRDRNAFESAVHHPKSIFYYDQGDLFDMAAAYCFHIAQAQAFLDGNKRTGVAAAIVFLNENGYPITGDSMRIHKALIAVAEGEMGRDDIAALLRELTAWLLAAVVSFLAIEMVLLWMPTVFTLKVLSMIVVQHKDIGNT